MDSNNDVREKTGSTHSMIDESHFGDLDDIHEPQNPDLAPDGILIKRQGEEAVETTVEFRGGDGDAE